MLGGNKLRQHVVEFIRGVGVVTDGVVDATSLNGPWNWQGPDGVSELTMDACAGGQSGMGGATVTGGITSAGGGAGGASGACVSGARLVIRPRSTLTITLGAGGAATNANQRGNSGGNTTVSGVLSANLDPSTSEQIRLAGGSQWQQNQPTSVSSGQGLGSNGTTGNGSAQPPPDLRADMPISGVAMPGRDAQATHAHGGAGNATGSVAGFAGATLQSFNPIWVRIFMLDVTAAAGTTDGTTSRGGGGLGMPSVFGRGGNGGSNAAGENSPSYGAGGGGGAGGFGGGSAGDGYVRFTYWSMD